MPFPLITEAQLRNRVGNVLPKRVYDDDGIGEAAEDSVDRLLRDASAKVLSYLGGNYDVDVIRSMSAEDLPDELVRLTLDAAQAMIAIRSPMACEWDGNRLMLRVNEDLKMLRMNLTTTGVSGSPEPPANTGAEVFSLDPSTNYEPEDHTFLNGFGDF